MAQRSIYTRKLANEIAEGAWPSIPGSFHIIPLISGKWGVVLHGTTRTIRAFTGKREAISYAKSRASAKLVNEIVVHNERGTSSYSIFLAGSF